MAMFADAMSNIGVHMRNINTKCDVLRGRLTHKTYGWKYTYSIYIYIKYYSSPQYRPIHSLENWFICMLHIPNHLVLNNDIETYGKYWPRIGQMLKVIV